MVIYFDLCNIDGFSFLLGAAILRIPILYGEVEKLEESAVTIMFDKVQFNNKSANMDHWQQRFPTYAKDVAIVCQQLAERRMLVRTFFYVLYQGLKHCFTCSVSTNNFFMYLRFQKYMQTS